MLTPREALRVMPSSKLMPPPARYSKNRSA
jgi:hypothetical protein